MPDRNSTPLAEDAAAGATVLLVIDMLGDWAHPQLHALRDAALGIAPAIAALKARCAACGVPTIYANDNQGRWRSDFREVVETARRAGGAAAEIARLVEPQREDYFVLKPKHSAFFSTPLDLLLRHLEARRLLLAGVAADQCVLATAADALMRDFRVEVVADGVAAPTTQRLDAVLRHFAGVMRLPMRRSAEIGLPG